MDEANEMALDLEKELLWIENKCMEITEQKDVEEGRICENFIEDKCSNDTIADIERFIDDSYMSMLQQCNERKDNEIFSLRNELIDAYEVQHQVLLDSYALPIQFEEEEGIVDNKNYEECHTRLCYELYLGAFEKDLKKEEKGNSLISGLLCLNMNGLKTKNIKPFLFSTRHLFKRSSSKIRKHSNSNESNVTKRVHIIKRRSLGRYHTQEY